MSVLEGVAQLAVDLLVGALDAALVVEGALALKAGEALAVVQTGLGRHLLSLKDLNENDNRISGALFDS